MWLVRQQLSPKSDSKSRYVFRGRFCKDIHVSPFMPPTGWYTVDTSDPCAPSKPGQLDILVTLTSPEGKPLMVTRVESTEPGLDVSRASMWEKVSFLAQWWYVATCTVITYKILSQAARIYFVKATQTWTRREPRRTALGKPARMVERCCLPYPLFLPLSSHRTSTSRRASNMLVIIQSPGAKLPLTPTAHRREPPNPHLSHLHYPRRTLQKVRGFPLSRLQLPLPSARKAARNHRRSRVHGNPPNTATLPDNSTFRAAAHRLPDHQPNLLLALRALPVPARGADQRAARRRTHPHGLVVPPGPVRRPV